MGKRSDTIETVILAVELLRRIPRGRKITAAELHRQLEDAGIHRDLRTIQRQLELLSDHFQIERDDRTRPYGYCWLKEARGIALPNLTAQESLVLQLAEEHLRQLLPASLMRAMQTFFAQARRNLDGETSPRLEKQWPRKIRVVATSQPLLPPEIKPGVFETVSDALYTNHWLDLTYRNASGRVTEARVMPLGLAQQGPRLYLVGRYQGFDNERSLALHRIESASMSSSSFDRPSDFDLKKYDDDGRFGFGEGRMIRLSFQIEAAAGLHLLESPLSKDQQVREAGNGLIALSATVVDTAMLDWWLRGFGDAIRNIRKVSINQV